MKRIKSTSVFLLMMCSIMSFSQKTDTIYFDKKWKETDRKNHQFYRLLPLKKIGDLSLVIDYHKNGKMQCQAYAYSGDDEKTIGDMYWYDESGFDNSYYFRKNPTNLTLKYYHSNGTLWREVPYKNGLKHGKVKVYDPKGKLRYTIEYDQSKVVGNTIGYVAQKESYQIEKPYNYTLYWLDNKHKAKEVKYSKSKQILKQDIFSKNGKLLTAYTKSDFINNKLKKGTIYREVTQNGFVVDFKNNEQKAIQSKIIPIKNVEYIATRRGYYNFITRADDDKLKYIRSSFFLDQNIPEMMFHINQEESWEISENIPELISVKNIKKQSVNELLKTISQKQWVESFTNKNKYSDGPEKRKIVFKQYNESLFLNLVLGYGDAGSRGFGSYYTQDDDNKQRWRVYDADFYTIAIALINGEKPVVMLIKGGRVKYFIIPLNDGTFHINYDEKHKLKMKDNSPLTNDQELRLMKFFKTEELYKIKSKNNKKYIASVFDEELIHKPYDSIKRKNQFILAFNDKKTDIYNLKLEKLPLKNIRKAYFDRFNLQVLSGNEVSFINLSGNNTKRQPVYYSFCGTVSSTDFTIMDEDKKRPKIEIYNGGLTHEHYTEYVYLKNLKNKQDITFLDKTKKDGYDGNSSFVDGYVNRTSVLLVKDNNKFGMYTYSQKVPRDSVEVNAKKILPIKYTDIELREPLIILKKNEKIGIYKDKNGLIYKSFGKINVNFVRYEKLDGEKGWLDINTFESYPDK